MKKKVTASFVLAMVSLLLAASALAWGLMYSPELSATLTARKAVMDKYGLSREAMDMFGASAQSDKQGTIVRFTALGEIAEVIEKTGIYTAEIDKEGNVTVQWTHDGADPATWADGSLEDAIWGAKQILAYRAQRDQENRDYTQRHEGKDGALVEQAPTPTEVPRGMLTMAQAIEAADTLMKKTYGFTDETLALYEPYAGFAKTEAQALKAALGDKLWLTDETSAWFDSYASLDAGKGDLWVIIYHPEAWTFAVISEHEGPSENTPLGVYAVTISDQTGEAHQIKWSKDGKAHGSYTSSTWGQAKEYTAAMLPWVNDLLRVCKPIYQKGESAPGAWSVEDHAAYDQASRDAGFDATKYNHVLPQKGDCSYEQALELAAQVLAEEFGVSRAVFDASALAYADLTQEGDHREWYFWLQNQAEQCGWSVLMNAETGEILRVGADPFASGNG
ncbi:MAG: hypothetical protein RR065_09660 [Clostridia bacterium]